MTEERTGAEPTEYSTRRMFNLATILLIFSFVLFLCQLVNLSISPAEASGLNSLPFSIRATAQADYSRDAQIATVPNIDEDIIQQIIMDIPATGSAQDRMGTMQAVLSSPVPTMTSDYRFPATATSITSVLATSSPVDASPTARTTAAVTLLAPTRTSAATPTAIYFYPTAAPSTSTKTPKAPAKTATTSHTWSQTPTRTSTSTITMTATGAHTVTPTGTTTAMQTLTATSMATATGTSTPTASATQITTATASLTQTPTASATASPTSTHTSTPTVIPSQTATLTPSGTVTQTPTPTPTATQTPSLTATPTATDTPTPTPTATASPTATQIPSQTASATPTASQTLTFTPSPTLTGTATFITTATASTTPTETPSPIASATPTFTSTPSHTPTLTATHTSTASATPTATASQTQTSTPTVTFTPTATSGPGLPACYSGTPNGILPSDDTYIQSGGSNPRGSDDRFEVRPDNGSDRRGLLKFDLSHIPQNATVSSATLYLYERDDKSGQITYIYRVTSNWDEGSATWLTWLLAGGDFDSSLSFFSYIPGQRDCMLTIDITSLVQAWVNGTYTNHGFMLYSTGSNSAVEYPSKENSITSQHPKLDVIYSVP